MKKNSIPRKNNIPRKDSTSGTGPSPSSSSFSRSFGSVAMASWCSNSSYKTNVHKDIIPKSHTNVFILVKKSGDYILKKRWIVISTMEELKWVGGRGKKHTPF